VKPTLRGRPGVFLTLEGGEGAGKSTLARGLAERARADGVDVVVTREPGGTADAEAVRHVVLSGAAKRFGAFGEALLFAAARADHVRAVIRPALARGALVICARFSDSTRAYQGIAGGLDHDILHALERVAIGSTGPDLTLILDIDPHDAVARRHQRAGTGDRFEDEGSAFHVKLREAFRQIARDNPQRCRLLDAAQSKDKLGAEAWGLVEGVLAARTMAVHA